MRIVLADDHSLVRESLRQYLMQLAEKVDVLEAGSLHEMMQFAKEPADLVVMDLQMPGMNGPRSVNDVRTAFAETPIVVVSGFTDPAVIRTVMQFGANGYIPKTARGKSLVMALKMVLEGETYLPPSLLEDEAASRGETRSKQSGTEDSGPSDGFDRLSEREADVLRLLISGKSNKEIGRDLDLQEVTVKVHLRNIYRKIKASNRTDAVRLAMTRGWK